MPTGEPLGDVTEVRVEIYRVFPLELLCQPNQRAAPFSTDRVPTRVNSPADVELVDRDAAAGNLTFTPGVIASSFTAANSVLNGIHPKPNQTTGGDGPVTGEEVQFNVTFSTPIHLPAGHYFFVPQVELSSGDFYWLSAPKPIVPPGTPFTPTCRHGRATSSWPRIGCGSEPTSSAALRRRLSTRRSR